MVHAHGAYLQAGFAHELVFSGLSWPTLDKPFWLDVGNNSLSHVEAAMFLWYCVGVFWILVVWK